METCIILSLQALITPCSLNTLQHTDFRLPVLEHTKLLPSPGSLLLLLRLPEMFFPCSLAWLGFLKQAFPNSSIYSRCHLTSYCMFSLCLML